MLRHGEVFAGYVIERELGRGGMGSVFAARHPRLPRLIALKLLNRNLFGDEVTRTRFEREADVVAQLDHPNIVTVFDRGTEDEQLWIAMQFVDGTDCASIDPASLTPERALQIVVQIANALDYAHSRGVLHRDVKPANILLSRSAGAGVGFGERVLLTDFGIARVVDDNQHLTRTGTFNATMAYCAPEQLTDGPVDFYADQYSLACTLFRLLTGAGPFDSDSVGAVMLGHIQQPPPAVSSRRDGLPPALDQVLARALSKQPADRYPSCSEFAQAAWRTLSGPVGPLTTSLRTPPAIRQPRTHPSLSLRDVVHGGLLGGAVGDALGAPVEAMLLANIVQHYGREGVTGGRNSFEGRISEETQLTLFTTEALIRSSVRARARGTGTTLGLVQEGLLVWLRAQGQTLPEQSHPLFSSLERFPELMSNRGPTSSTTKAMLLVAARGQPRIPLGTRTAPITDSKGCAATVRSVPCGFARTPEHAFELGCDTAALTHGDPSGWLPAGTLAAIVAGLDSGLSIAAAVEQALAILTRHPEHLETSSALTTALRLADEITRHTTTAPTVGALKPLGYGVIGPETLALAVCAALTAEAAGGTPTEIFRAGVLLAVNHSGDSDSTGAIAGSILGARHGVAAIPAEWRTALDAASIVEHLALDFCREFGPNPPSTPVGTPTDDWFARYPS